MATTEHTINDAIAELLRGTRWAWRGEDVVRSETTQLLAESGGLRPDILVTEPYTAPVVIETEVLPAVNVEVEAIARLDEKLSGSGRPVLSSIAIRLPTRFRDVQGQMLKSAIESAEDLEFAFYTGKSSENYARHPVSGWLTGGIHELSLLVQSATLPPLLIDQAASILEIGVSEAAGLLDGIAKVRPGSVRRMAEALHQQDSPQTRRMAAAVMANAFMFHEALAGGPGELEHIRPLEELRSGLYGMRKSAVAAEWRKILKVNYWSIFDIALRLMSILPTRLCQELIGRLSLTAEALLQNDLMRSHDLTGAVFQRLISDRKFLAAFYTKPASAALLVGLAVNSHSLLNDVEWSDAERVKSLRIADFSCGTGTLLSIAYQRISQLHELHGGDSASLHPVMMSSVLLGCDILPAAAHLTASMLSSAHPAVKYEGSRVFTLPYGLQDDDTIALGSIDLLRDMALLQGSEITAKAIEGASEAELDAWKFAPHVSFDLVIMNPPFTRATNHEGEHENVPNPMFAAFGSSAEEQKAMANAAKKLTSGTIAHGNAGEASIFLALADRKLAQDGMLAMVMPLSLMTGASWEKCRARLAEAYENLILISVAGSGNKAISFSADTSMGECLIIGRRNGKRQSRATFVVLENSPESPTYSVMIAKQVLQLINDNAIRRLEDRPAGGTHIAVGSALVGQAIDAPLPRSGGWKLARIVDFSLAQSAYHLSANRQVWLPRQTKPATISMTTVSQIGELGPVHRDINGTNPNGSIRGPLEIRQLRPDSVPTYPVLWAHNNERERTLVFEADREGIPRHVDSAQEQSIIDEKAAQVFETASHCHSNLDFGFNGQSTAMQFTRVRTIGGRAWISVGLPKVEHEKSLVLWGNSLLGLLMFWWHSSKQHPGRGILTKTTLQTLPILDVTALSTDQLAQAAKIFDEACQLPLKPLHELDIDENRKILDRRFYGEVLGLPDSIFADGGPLDILRQKLSREPSIRGSKPPPQTPPP
ncbi:MAG: hypothetical protein OXG84_14265 [Chloroflexi bacterium]|nr:hypothetical protein [Chloroflexota bacterium]